MKKSQFIKVFKNGFLLLAAGSLMVACKSNPKQSAAVNRAVVKSAAADMMTNIQRDVSGKGPIAWLDYFDDSPDFFMVSDGSLVFQDYDAAKAFITNTLVKTIPHIHLQFTNVRIEALTAKLASVAAGFHEELTDPTGKILPVNGYFTGIAHLSGNTWKLRNANWSIKPTAASH